MGAWKRVYDRFWGWLEEEPTGSNYWRFLRWALVVMFCYSFSAGFFIVAWKLPKLFLAEEVVEERIRIIADFILNGNPYLLFLVLIKIVFWEEFRFRWVPLFIASKLFKKSYLILLTLVASSIIFGWIHSPDLENENSYVFIFLQGMGSIVLSIVYLKCGILHNKIFKAAFSSFFVHYVFDVLLSAMTIVLFHFLQTNPEGVLFLKKIGIESL